MFDYMNDSPRYYSRNTNAKEKSKGYLLRLLIQETTQFPSVGVHDTLYQPSAISRKGRKSYSDGLTSYVFVYLSEDCLNPNA